MKERDKKRMHKFGNHLRKIRQKKGLSMRQLAALCDIDYAKLSKVETNKANLSVTTLFEIADGLGVHPKELLNFDIE